MHYLLMLFALFATLPCTGTGIHAGGESVIGESLVLGNLRAVKKTQCKELISSSVYDSSEYPDNCNFETDYLPRYDEHSVWIRSYRGSSRHGIGGVLTHWWRPSDFEVIELDLNGRKVTSATSSSDISLENVCNGSSASAQSPSGQFLIFTLQKQGWDTLSALSAITKRLNELGTKIDVSQFG